MKLLCKLFGHKWSERRYMYGPFVDGIKTRPYKKCLRCNEFAWDFNRSALDESENVFHEKWLDKHMD
ncbi:DUF1660 domain-containing protein [Lactococcus cremoris]|uniref:DUF1660 domain-containing protein n=1 Tax=Lactococcus lactis subsp. cremoris TaxID=1359 RepID=UPI000E09DB89|nr:DUF1660 domain-containing protein [Lactococcus cremoris]RDG21290.1 hypothetical protein DQM05_11960 [Lactococcus cremoris]